MGKRHRLHNETPIHLLEIALALQLHRAALFKAHVLCERIELILRSRSLHQLMGRGAVARESIVSFQFLQFLFGSHCDRVADRFTECAWS